VRLKKTWKAVSRSRKAAWDKLLSQMSPQKSFASYRGCIRQAHAPLVPYLGVYMQDMVFIEDGNPDYLVCLIFVCFVFLKSCCSVERLSHVYKFSQTTAFG
jgi:hypothetical protein